MAMQSAARTPNTSFRRTSLSVRATVNETSPHGKLVRLSASTRLNYTASRARDNFDASVKNYFLGASSVFTSLSLPMGGTLSRLEGNALSLTIPRITLFEVYLEPTAIAYVEAKNGGLDITSTECRLGGSHHVQQFGLDEKFKLKLNIRFTATEPAAPEEMETVQPMIHADGNIEVEVDLPPPFCYLPGPVVTTTGNAALKASTEIILKTFVSSLAEDYEKWCTSPSIRIKRQIAQADVMKAKALAAK